MELTQQVASELFSYRNGDLVRKVTTQAKAKAGEVISRKNADGYLIVKINQKMYLAHRVIFLMHYGYLPKELDHIDGNPVNNRIENLRVATRSQNNANRGKRANTSSPYKGVTWHAARKKWRSEICVNGKKTHLGLFADQEDAALIYAVNALRYYGEFSRF